MPARFVDEARAELLNFAADYARKRPGLGERFITAVEQAVDFAERFPLAGAPWLQGTRCVYTRQFPFAVVYQPRGDDIVVFAIAHVRRRPSYWKDRLKRRG